MVSLCCHRLLCGLWLWHLLVVLTCFFRWGPNINYLFACVLVFFLWLPQVGLWSMIVVFPGRAHLFLSVRPIVWSLTCLCSCDFSSCWLGLVCGMWLWHTWSCSLVSLDEAHILNINLPVFLWLFLLLTQVGLWSMIETFPVVLMCFSRRGPYFNY